MDIKELESKLKEIVANAVKENINGAVEPIVEERIKAALNGLTLDKIAAASSKSGISYTAKKEFAEKIKAMAEGTTTAGGFLVPEEIAQGVARIAEDYGLVRRFATILPMGGDTLNVPRLTTSVSVTWPGENTAGTESDAVLGNVQLLAKTAIGLTAVSNELLADANISIVDLLLTLFAEALAGAEDEQGLVGTGSPFTGILGDANVTVVTMAATKTAFTDITADNLIDLRSQVKPLALANAGYIMHRSVFGIVQKLKDASGNLILTSASPIVSLNSGYAGAGLPAGYIQGYPVYLSDKMPTTTGVGTKFVIFGSLKHLFLGDRQQVTVSVSEDATIGGVNAFAANQKAVRVTERVAVAVGLPSAFAVLKTAAS